MELRDLIDDLEQLAAIHGEKIEVMSSADYGDHTHTEELNFIRSIEVAAPVKTAYSHSGLAFPDEEDNDREFDYETQEPEEGQIVVLRYT